MHSNRPVIYVEDPSRVIEGKHLSHHTGLPLVQNPQDYLFVLTLTKNRLELRVRDEKFKPIAIDFLSKQMNHRLNQARKGNELIARAIGLTSHFSPTVVDATAGFAQDALILAHLGCQVMMLERSPILSALIVDALLRAKKVMPEWIDRLQFYEIEACAFLQSQLAQQITIDAIYLDPMFPIRKKTAQVKKEMQVLQSLVGIDNDTNDLFALAIEIAKKRVVVKRPLHADTLTKIPPTIQYRGRSCRFDVYLTSVRK